jgi:hypothetical protein
MTSDPIPDDSFDGNVLTIQIINGAMFAGVTMFLLIVLFLRSSGKDGLLSSKPLSLAAPITLFGIVLAIGCPILASVVPGLVVRNARRAIASGTWRPPQGNGQPGPAPATDAGRFLALYTTQRIIALALLEAAAFFNLIAFMIEGQGLSLLLSVVLLGCLLLGFPTPGRVVQWVDHQLELMRMEPQ